MTGWVSIHRSIQDNPIWLEERFTKGQAWVDLILMVNHEKNTTILGFKRVEINRGQTITSQVKLAKRWKWDRKTVRKFLSLLECEKMITQNVDRSVQQGKTVITITNYDKYQSGTQLYPQQQGQQSPSKMLTNNNDNNENKIHIGENPQTPNPDKKEIKQREVVRPKDRKGREIVSTGWEHLSDEEAQKRLRENPSWVVKENGRVHDRDNGWKEVCVDPAEYALYMSKDPMKLVDMINSQLGNVI